MTKIHIKKGDINRFEADAVVESHQQNRNDKDSHIGKAKLSIASDAFKRHIIKTIVPKWHGGDGREMEMLARSQIACLDTASEAGVSAIAFPADSIGYGDIGANVAMSATALWIDHFGLSSSVKDVYFISDDDHMRESLDEAYHNTGLSS